MSQSEKAELYRELKDAGVNFERHYREYSTEELAEGVKALRARQAAAAADQPPLFEIPDEIPPTPAEEPQLPPRPEPIPPSAPVAQRNPAEMPGQRLNSKPEDEPIRVDENGLVWYQEEVRKASYAKPRGRRVLNYMDTGVREETVKAGEYTETFEVAGQAQSRPAQVKITLPSYQVGIYKDPRLPFKIHVYNENRGFDLFEVQDYYGGAELVPMECKRIYVENVLCYDIRTVIRAIQTEYRQLQLQNRV